ncbi:MAG: hypothetical protein AB7E84_03070 [Xanthobacteraceae bacterium]
MSEMNGDNLTEQERTWGILYAKILEVVHEFGTDNQFGEGDYLVVTDNYGWPRHTIEIHKLHMLQPAIVNRLRELLSEFAGWEIVVAVDIPGTESLWPRMGLTIRAHEIIGSFYLRRLITFDTRGAGLVRGIEVPEKGHARAQRSTQGGGLARSPRSDYGAARSVR